MESLRPSMCPTSTLRAVILVDLLKSTTMTSWLEPELSDPPAIHTATRFHWEWLNTSCPPPPVPSSWHPWWGDKAVLPAGGKRSWLQVMNSAIRSSNACVHSTPGSHGLQDHTACRRDPFLSPCELARGTVRGLGWGRSHPGSVIFTVAPDARGQVGALLVCCWGRYLASLLWPT